MKNQFDYIDKKINYEMQLIKKLQKDVRCYTDSRRALFIGIVFLTIFTDILLLKIIISKINGSFVLFLLSALFTCSAGYLEGKLFKAMHRRLEKYHSPHIKNKIKAINMAKESITFLKARKAAGYMRR